MPLKNTSISAPSPCAPSTRSTCSMFAHVCYPLCGAATAAPWIHQPGSCPVARPKRLEPGRKTSALLRLRQRPVPLVPSRSPTARRNTVRGSQKIQYDSINMFLRRSCSMLFNVVQCRSDSSSILFFRFGFSFHLLPLLLQNSDLNAERPKTSPNSPTGRHFDPDPRRVEMSSCLPRMLGSSLQ